MTFGIHCLLSLSAAVDLKKDQKAMSCCSLRKVDKGVRVLKSRTLIHPDSIEYPALLQEYGDVVMHQEGTAATEGIHDSPVA